jgi:hypothetical protein
VRQLALPTPPGSTSCTSPPSSSAVVPETQSPSWTPGPTGSAAGSVAKDEISCGDSSTSASIASSSTVGRKILEIFSEIFSRRSRSGSRRNTMTISSNSVLAVGSTEGPKSSQHQTRPDRNNIGAEIRDNFAGEYAVQRLMPAPSFSSPSCISGNVALRKAKQKIGYTADEWAKLHSSSS